MHNVDNVRDEKNVTLYRHEIGRALRAALCTACAAPPPVRLRAVGVLVRGFAACAKEGGVAIGH